MRQTTSVKLKSGAARSAGAGHRAVARAAGPQRIEALPGDVGRPLPAREGVGWYSRGYHQHFDPGYGFQSITFRLVDSVPLKQIELWRHELTAVSTVHNNGQRVAVLLSRIAAYEHAGYGACWLKDAGIAELVQATLLHHHGERYHLIEWCVMPNHVHVLIELLAPNSIAAIVRSWKTYTARRANALLGRNGRFWMADYYDRFVRDERHFAAVCNYIQMNPVKAGLCTEPRSWRWSSAGQSIQW